MPQGEGIVSLELHHDDAANDAATDAPAREADLRRFHLAHLALRMHGDDLCRGLAALRPGDTEKAHAIGRLWMIYEAAVRGHDVAESALCARPRRA